MLREQLAVTSCVFKETEIPILWAEAKRVKRRKDTPTPPRIWGMIGLKTFCLGHKFPLAVI